MRDSTGRRVRLTVQLPMALTKTLVPSTRTKCNLPVNNMLTASRAMVPCTMKVSVNYQVDLAIFSTGPSFLGQCTRRAGITLGRCARFNVSNKLRFARRRRILSERRFQLAPLLRGLRKGTIQRLKASKRKGRFIGFKRLRLRTSGTLRLPTKGCITLLSRSNSQKLKTAVTRRCDFLTHRSYGLPHRTRRFT